MALRLRRGLKSELDNLPLVAEGELIFTTDEGKLYVGTGGTGLTAIDVTGGGGGATTLDALTDTNVSSPTNNQVLTWDDGTSKWIPTTLPGVGSLSLNDLTNVNTNPSFKDILQYDGITWTALSLDDLSNGATLKSNIVGDNSSIIVNIENNSIYGNIRASDGTITFASDTGDVSDSSGSVLLSGVNRLLIGDVVGFLKGDVINAAETKVLLDHTTEVFHGTLNGNVFGEDSGVIVDALTSRIYASQIDNNQINTTGTLTVKRLTIGRATHKVEGLNGDAALRLTAHRDGVIAGSGYSNSIVLGASGSDGTKNTTALYAAENILYLTQDGTGGLTTEAKYITFDSTSGIGKFGIGTYTPSEVLDVAGNIKATGTIQPGVYASAAARDAAITAPVAGQMVYITDIAKFQGNTDSTITGWVNLN